MTAAKRPKSLEVFLSSLSACEEDRERDTNDTFSPETIFNFETGVHETNNMQNYTKIQISTELQSERKQSRNKQNTLLGLKMTTVYNT